jgi:cytosine deaminase
MDKFMQLAIDEAKQGLKEGGIPIGSVLVHDGKVLGKGHNRRIQNSSCTLHGEMDALENAGRLSAAIYKSSTLYTTLSPCSMCSGAIILYGIGKVVIAENKTFMGEETWLADRGVKLKVLQNQECISLMQGFIKAKPELWNEDIGV